MSGDVSLYFHIPFCTKKCPYCHFYVVKDNPLLRKKYLNALKKEWEQKAPLLNGKKIISLYFGGGTPSLLDEKELEFIFSFFSFPLKDIEITLEANPEHIEPHIWKKLGINRVSLGAQTFDDALLHTLGRNHTSSKIISATHAIHKAGIENISLDLMYDIPNLTLNSFKTTINTITSLPITHISLYNLVIEPHTQFFKIKDRLQIPPERDSLHMLQEALAIFETQGFHRYEISAFAKNNLESKHNTGYWLGRPFLGFGPSAFSYWDSTRFSNVANILEYERRLNRNDSPIDFSEKLSLSAHLREWLAIRLRYFKPFSLNDPTPLQTLIQDGFIKEENNTYCLTNKGCLFYDTVAESLIEETGD